VSAAPIIQLKNALQPSIRPAAMNLPQRFTLRSVAAAARCRRSSPGGLAGSGRRSAGSSSQWLALLDPPGLRPVPVEAAARLGRRERPASPVAQPGEGL